MNGDIRFEALDITVDDNLTTFKKLHNTLFPNTDINQEWIDWYMLDTAQEVQVYGAWDGTQMIGMWCVEAKKLRVSEDSVIGVGRCFAVGIDPDYRRRNLFVELSQFSISEEQKRGKFEYILGFPQVGKPVVQAHIKAGWERVQRIEMYSYKPTKGGEKLPLTHARFMDNFVDGSLERPTHFGSFVEDNGYRNSRWRNHPDNYYICLARSNAYIVLKQYANICHVLDIGGDESKVKSLLQVATALAYRHKWNELTIWCANNEVYWDTVLSAGFQLGSEHGLSIDMLAVRINAKEPLKLDSCHFSMGSEEIY